MRWLWSLSAGITMIRDPPPEFDRGGLSENLSQDNHVLKRGATRIGICILITNRARSLAGLCSSIKRV